MSKLVWVVVLFATAGTARALIQVGTGNDPVHDSNWPAGALEVANLKTRVGWWEGPPFGGGERQFLYRGDVEAFQQALDLFGKIRAPKLELVIHEGPEENQFLKETKDAHVDWAFTVWDPRSFNQLFNNPQSFFESRDPGDRFRRSIDPPRIDLYVAGEDGKGIDVTRVKVPANVRVSDERATSAGYPPGAGSVVRGDVYDMITSKPIAGVTLALTKFDGKKDWQRVAEAKSDANGHLELKNAPAGSFRITASAGGYVPRTLGYVTLGRNTLKEYENGIYLAPPVKVGGTVSDTDGKPLSGVKVRVDTIIGADGRGYVPPEELETTSDDKGRFELTGVPGGHVQIFASDASHQMLEFLKLLPAPSSDIALRMTATGTVTGRVLKKDGSPAGDAQVDVEPEGETIGKWGGGMNVKPDGTFRFENVPPGTYTISASPGMAKLGKDPKAKKIEVKAGETVTVELTK